MEVVQRRLHREHRDDCSHQDSNGAGYDREGRQAVDDAPQNKEQRQNAEMDIHAGQ